MRRAKVVFAGRTVEFVDRSRAIKQIEELGEKGTWRVFVVYGPEGCGKTALLRQAAEILEDELGYSVIYVNPLAERAEELLAFTPSIRDIVKEVLGLFPEPYSRTVDVAVSIASYVVKRLPRPRVAVLMDDIFQAVGLDRAEAYVKTLLNLIEWPPAEYERIIVLVTSSEGVTRTRVGRHRWAEILTMWNMPLEGFGELYNLLPEPKPSLEAVWRLTGGNPKALEELYRENWSADRVTNKIILGRGVTYAFVSKWGRYLEEAVEDPDSLWRGAGEAEKLVGELVERNLIVFHLPPREEGYWVDEPPPERDLELGVGRYVAWQTPLHREAVRRALEQAQRSA